MKTTSTATAPIRFFFIVRPFRTLAPSDAPSHRRTTRTIAPSEPHHRAARQRGVAGDDVGAALVHVPCGVLLHVRTLRRHAVDRHDPLVPTLRRSTAGADD